MDADARAPTGLPADTATPAPAARLAGSSVPWTPAVAWMVAASAALALAWPATSWMLHPDAVRDWRLAALGTTVAAALLGFSLYVTVRHVPTYMAWERLRARLGLPHAPPPTSGNLYRQSSLFNWGLLGDGEVVLAHLDTVSGGDGSKVPREARMYASRSAWRNLVIDLLASITLVLLAVLWLVENPNAVLAFVAAGLAASYPVTMMNAARYQDPWLKAYRQYAMAQGPGAGKAGTGTGTEAERPGA